MAERKISARFELHGESQYREKINQINSAQKTLKSEMAKTTSQFTNNQNSTEALTAKLSVMERQCSTQADKVREMSDALKAAQATQEEWGNRVEESKTKVNDLTQRLEELQAADGDTTKEQEQLTAELKKGVAAQEAAERGYKASEQSVDQWTRKLNYAEADLNKLSAEIDKNKQLFSQAQQSTDGAAQAVEKYGEATEAAMEKSGVWGDIGKGAIEKISGAFTTAGIAAVVSKIGNAFVDAAKDTEAARVSLVQYTGVANENLESLMDAMDKVVAKSPQTAEAVGSIVGAVHTRFDVMGDELDNYAAQFERFSRATGEDGVAAVKYVGDIISTYKLSLSDIPDVLDQLTAAKQYSGAELSQFAEALNKSSFYADQNGKSLTDMIILLAEAEKRGVEANVVYDQMKDTFKNLGETGMTWDDFVSGIRDGSIDVYTALENMSEEGAQLYNIIADGTLDIKSAESAMKNYKGAVDRTVAGTATFGSIMKTAWNDLTHATKEQRVADAELLEQIERYGSLDEYNRMTGEYAAKHHDAAAAVREQTEAIDGMVGALEDAKNAGDNTSDALDSLIGIMEDNRNSFAAAIEGYDGTVTSLKAMKVELNTLNAEYQAAADLADKNTTSLMGMFNYMDTGAKRSVSDMIAAMDSQLQWMDQYAVNLAEATRRGVDEGLLQQLSDGSQESAEILAGLVDASDDKIKEFNDKWEETQEGKKAFVDNVAEMATDFDKRAGDIEERMRLAVDSFNQNAEAFANGVKTMRGVIDGANSLQGDVWNTYYNLGKVARDGFNYAFSASGVSFSGAAVSSAPGAIRSSGVSGSVDAQLGEAQAFNERWR